MKFMKLLLCAAMFATSYANAFELSDLTARLFEDKATGVEGQFNDSKFELKVQSAIMLNESLRVNTHIIVSRNRDSVLIAGQAASQELKDKVQRLVLETAHLKWTQGDVSNVEPSNAQVCGKKASKMAANDRRRFNLKAVKECSTVNRFYNEVRVASPMSEIEQSDDDLLRATIVNKLLHAGVINRADSIKVAVSDAHVYLLGDQLNQKTADETKSFISDLPGVKKVVPLFRF